MRVDALWRYPVKSMLGERLERAEVDRRGVAGDRLYAVRDGAGKPGSGKRSHPQLRDLAEQLPEIPVDERRFRPNIVLNGNGEWPGRTASIGSAVIEFVEPTERCVMVNAPEPDIEESGAVLQHLARNMEFGVYARVMRPGIMTVGDEVRFR